MSVRPRSTVTTDGGPWRGAATPEWLARITHGSNVLLAEMRGHVGGRPIRSGPSLSRRAVERTQVA